MNLSSSSISIWTMTVPVIGLFSIIALNRASLSTIEWPQKWPRQETEDVAQWNETFFEGAFLNHTQVLHMCFERFLLAFESHDLSQADKRINPKRCGLFGQLRRLGWVKVSLLQINFSGHSNFSTD